MDLIGWWIWVSDSDGSSPIEGSRVSLLFRSPDQLAFAASKADEHVQDDGTWTITATGMISLELKSFGVTVTDKPYQLDGDVLTLPFMVLNEGNGTSRWHLEVPPAADQDDVIAVAYQAYEQALFRGASDAAAADAAAAAVTASSAPPGSSSPSDVGLNATKSGLTLLREGGRVYLFLNTRQPLSAEFKNAPPEKKLTEGYFMRDPRTPLYMKPDRGLNDPAAHTAALFFPFNTQPSFDARGGGVYRNSSAGERPEVLRRQLQRAGFELSATDVAVDRDASAAAITKALLSKPGVFYISTHGMIAADGQYVFATGTLVGMEHSEADDWKAFDAAVEAEVANGLPGDLKDTLEMAIVKADRFQNSMYIGLGKRYFDALAKKGMNLSRSFVYVDACNSATPSSTVDPVPSAARYFRAASFAGWNADEDVLASVRYSQHFFRQAVRKTHSTREIWDHIQRVIATRQMMYAEDQDLDDADDPRKRVSLANHASRFVVLGADLKPYARLSDMVHWLVWLGRWNQDPAVSSSNLKSCYDQFWKDGKSGIGVSAMCQAGYLGGMTPSASDVKAARRLLHGEPKPVAGGRWTLADGIPYLDPVGTPYD